ncbi:Gvp36p [Lachancea thermotolerans CBS 6340]|uniref:KLTH0A03894p n=1 Tax=Lachancea thermotolerans (strain ATCC 56472 / CBS 6340 / NRRL Y-8284) TaxID=559295 RepID=C5DBM6_LACTC|nr:KLTH0A03894p [Lachancea thermotolerans CBS 6340]CAR21183.1 KLTH0A03894p [Lachancea thermotolerans CBS 6340]
MSFNNFADSVNKKLQELSSQVSQRAQDAQLDKKFRDLSSAVSQRTQDLTTQLPSFAQSTQRLVQEKLGQVTDISQLPQEYVELENKIDRVRLVYENFLKVTQVYENESYDYPNNVRDSVNEFSSVVAGKLHDLSRATSTNEAQSVLIAPGPHKDPKTLNYALSKVALTSSEYLNKSVGGDDSEVSNALLKYSDVQAKVAQARLQQDTLIQTRFNKKLRDILANDLNEAQKARKNVEHKRLQYDIARSNLANAKPEKEASLRVQMESLEDEFAQATDDAVVVMQKVAGSSELLKELRELVAAQADYHKQSYELLSEFLPQLESA